MRHLFLSILLALLTLSGAKASSAVEAGQGDLEEMLNRRTFINLNTQFAHFDIFFDDQQGRLWGCNFGGELALWNGTSFNEKAQTPGRVTCTYRLDNTDFLIGTEFGLARFNIETFELKTYDNMKMSIRDIYNIGSGELLMLTDEGVYRGKAEDMHFSCVLAWNKMALSGTCRQDVNRYMILSRYKGIWRYDAVTNSLEEMQITGYDIEHEIGLTFMLENDSIWVGTDRGVYTGMAAHGAELTSVPELEGMTSKCMQMATDGAIWVGTDKGLFVREAGQAQWNVYSHTRKNSLSLLNDCVWALHEDAHGNFWIGVEAGVCFSAKVQEYNYVDYAFGEGTYGNRVQVFLHDSQDRIWMGGADGLSMHDTRTGQNILFEKMDRHSCIDNRIWAIYEDRKGVVWICTDESVAYYDEHAETFVSRLVKDADTGKNSKWSYGIIDAGDGYMWIASGSGGFMQVRRDLLLGKEPTILAENAFVDGSHHHDLKSDVALFIHQAKDGSIWGRSLKGLYRLADSKDVSGVPSLAQPWSGISFSQTDEDGNIWIMCGQELCCYDPVKRVQTRYPMSSLGLSGELLSIASCGKTVCLLTSTTVALLKLEGGKVLPVLEQHESEFRNCFWDKTNERLWLGAVDYCMVVSLPQMEYQRRTYQRPVQIVTHQLTEDELTVTFSNGRPQEWSSPYTGYYYRLKGYDDAWIPVNRGMNIEIRKLKAGEYTLELARCQPGDVPDQIVDSFAVTVPHPWYQSWWFFGLLVLFIVVIAYSIVRHYSLKVQLQIAEADKQQLLEQYAAIKESALKAVANAAEPSKNAEGDKAKAAAEEYQIRLDNANKRWLEALQKQVEKHMSDTDLNVSRLAEISGLNEKALYRRVKTLTGKTSVEYLRDLRLQHAASLLLHQEFSVNEIMYMVGFTSSSYFSKCFEMRYGMTPSEYRVKMSGTDSKE